MTLNLMVPEEQDLKPKITVFGVGGAGGNAVNNMIAKALDGVDFVVANTDAQALQQTSASHRVQMGVKVTEGLGAGARPAVGAAAAEESIEEIVDHLAGAHMCFITAGMGGGTGTGAAPIIAQAARELGVLTVGVVTKPFQFEGAKRMKQAEEGVEQLQKVVDTLIIIPNQNLFRLATEKTTFTEAFSMADDVLYQGVKGVTDLMVRPGLINLDFADVRAVMDEMGKAMMGTGEAEGEQRAIHAAEQAIANPLLDEISLRGARGVLINITGGEDLTLFELDEAANRIREEVDPNANIIVGSTMDETMQGKMRVSVVATGIDANTVTQDIPVPRRRISEPLKSERTPAAEPAPVAQEPQPVMAKQAPAPQPRAMQEPRFVEEEEPSLFGDMPEAEQEDTGPAASFFSRVGKAAEPAVEPEIPEPVYQPRPVASFDEEPAAASFVAPKASAPGTPSPEALQRLRAAVSKAPRSVSTPLVAQAPEPTAPERPRFGINSLISRMAPHEAPHVPAPAPQRPNVAQAAPAQEQPERNEEQDRIEIPAFLRRQAN
jgi:cell division protein FtsZ